VASGVAVVDDALIEQEDPKAISRCPTGAIVWLQGAQFNRVASLAGSAGE
jgi:hypothetical protein